MNYASLAYYIIVTLSYLPLFFTIMIKIKKDHKVMFDKVYWKLTLIFAVLMIFLLFRLLAYIDLNFTHFVKYDSTITIFSEIPFFISEIIITFALSYILFKVGNNNNKILQKNKK